MLFLKRTNIARFEKVSYEEFRKTFFNLYFNENGMLNDNIYVFPSLYESLLCLNITKRELKESIEKIIMESYDNIIIPKVATSGSAGYDITIPFDIKIKSLFQSYYEHIETKRSSVIIPTGLKVFIKKGWVLELYPRSGWGIKGLKIENTVPIIDRDYYNNDKNEGHILIKLTNESKQFETFKFVGGETRIVQGLFKIYGTAGKPNKKKREGGFDSTSKEGSSLL